MKKRIFGTLLMGAFLVASMSTFVSCKDYDDDINNLQAQIDAKALKSDLESLRSSLSSELSTAVASLNTAIAAKADAATAATKTELGTVSAAVDALKSDVAKKADAEALASLVAEVASLQAKIEAIDAVLTANDLTKMAATLTALTGDVKTLQDALSGKADKSDVDAALTGKTDKSYVDAAVAGVQANLDIQTAALDKLTSGLTDLQTKVAAIKEYDDTAIKAEIAAVKENITTLQGDIKKLSDSLAEYAKASDVNELKTKVNELSEAINKMQAEINVLNVLVNKRLTSIVLRPAFYWEGIEAIEAGYISQTPVFAPVQKDYKFSYKVTNTTLGTDKVNVTVKEVMSSELEKAVSGKSYVVLEGAGSETISNGAAAIVSVWPKADEKSLTIADIDAAVKAFNKDAKAKKIDLARAVNAYYHINPSTCDIEGAKLAFFENDAEVYTRGEFDSDNSIAATPFETTFNSKENKYNVLKNAILKVPFKVNFNKVLSMFNTWTKGTTTDPDWDIDGHNAFGTGKQLPFIALQIAAKDTTVTSDYAVVVPAVYTIVALADKAPEVALDENTFVGWDKHAGVIRANHLYESVGYNGAEDHSDKKTTNLGAIPMPATHSVQYDKTIDLKPFIQTHYTYTSYTQYGTSTGEKLMTDADLEAFGLHYEFTPITYITDKNVTDQSAHIEQVDAEGNPTTDKKSGIFAPRSVTDKGETISGKVATREVIDREPLVRVDLVAETGEIVRYGYIKLRITEFTEEEQYNDDYATFEFGDAFMNCGTEFRVTWSQMENQILAKLNGGKGMTKQEFEKNYYMENAGGYKVMPSETGVTDPASPKGTLYQDAQDNKWWAVRYYETKAGKASTKTLYNGTATDNIFGRVWYTPHDNSTDAHAWDENTNVIVWNLYPGTGATMELGGNMDGKAYERMMEVAKATYDTKGINKEKISTIIRFINKNTGASVWVTLIIPVDKLHFQYAGIGNKDWSHWWEMNTQQAGYSGTTAPYWAELDVHANTPVPAANAYKALSVKQFEQDLYDYWKNKDILSLGYSSKDMSKFYTVAPTTTFEFTTPVKDLNSKTTTASSGKWKVKGVSGTVWTLQLANNNKSIVAVQKNGVAYGPEVVCYLADALDVYSITTTDGSIIHFNGLETASELYPAATDLLNKSGRYDELGNARYTKSADATKAAMGILDEAAYLAQDIDETFTAYLKINVTHECYNPLMGMNYFNVRFLRPINVAGKDYRVRDVLNKMQRIMISDLVDIIDYRDIPVVPFYADSEIDQVFNYGGAKFKAPKYIDVTPDNGLTVKEQNKGVPYEFYGITDLAVYYDNIRTDHDQEYAVRVKNDELGAAIPVASVEKLTKVKDLSSLASELTGSKPARVVSLYSNMSTIATDAPYSGVPMAKEAQWDVTNYLVTADGDYSRNIGKIEYTNNSGITQLFHIYVPIAIRYNWGNIRLDKVFGKPAKLDKNYTQTVWAVITVDPSYLSGSGEE
jgi:hypothetical protein